MLLGGIQRFTLLDYPGKIACTIFTVGCNFRCPFCHNSELVLPDKIKNADIISEEDFFDFLKKKKGLLEGVVICGGEPTIHKDLPEFAKKIKDMGFDIKLDTNGSNPDMLEKLIENDLVDYVAIDIKAPKEKYYLLAGLSQKDNDKLINNIEKSVSLLQKSKVNYEFRTTLVPKLLDKQDIISIAQWIKGSPLYVLQGFKPKNTLDPEFEKLIPYSDEYFQEIKKEVEPFFDKCVVRS